MLDSTLNSHIEAFEKLKNNKELQSTIMLASEKISSAVNSGNKLIIFGNGGSAADAQHIAAEFVGRFKKERNALPALALHCNTSVVTAIANDYDYNSVYSRQIEAFGNKGDVALGISTSGTSENIVSALQKAKDMGLFTIMLTGENAVDTNADLTIKASSADTPRIQEMHIFIGHFFAQYAEKDF